MFVKLNLGKKVLCRYDILLIIHIMILKELYRRAGNSSELQIGNLTYTTSQDCQITILGQIRNVLYWVHCGTPKRSWDMALNCIPPALECIVLSYFNYTDVKPKFPPLSSLVSGLWCSSDNLDGGDCLSEYPILVFLAWRLCNQWLPGCLAKRKGRSGHVWSYFPRIDLAYLKDSNC